MRLRFDKNLPDFVVANEIFYETKKNRAFCATFYKEDDLYKLQYVPRYLTNSHAQILGDEFPLVENIFTSSTVFQTFRNYLMACATLLVYRKYPQFSKTDNIFYQLPLVEKRYRDRFCFEPIYQNNLVIEDIEKICTYLDLNETEFAKLIGVSHPTLATRKQKNNASKMLLEQIENLFSSKVFFQAKFQDNLRHVHSEKKEIILKKMDHFFSQKYIIWDKIYV